MSCAAAVFLVVSMLLLWGTWRMGGGQQPCSLACFLHCEGVVAVYWPLHSACQCVPKAIAVCGLSVGLPLRLGTRMRLWALLNLFVCVFQGHLRGSCTVQAGKLAFQIALAEAVVQMCQQWRCAPRAVEPFTVWSEVEL
jgi:hypothetical protein